MEQFLNFEVWSEAGLTFTTLAFIYPPFVGTKLLLECSAAFCVRL
jgi:hypothetical protein